MLQYTEFKGGRFPHLLTVSLGYGQRKALLARGGNVFEYSLLGQGLPCRCEGRFSQWIDRDVLASDRVCRCADGGGRRRCRSIGIIDRL